ncbi:MAG: biotin transporter BioY [Halobacteriales archaeon]
MSTDAESVELVGDEVAGNVARAVLFAALVGAFAYVSFPYPLSPAPVTLQVLGVFLAGALLGPVWGGAAMVLYLAAGVVGLPVFAGGDAGLGVLIGPTGGYLLAYPPAAMAVGAVVHGGLSLDDHRAAGLARLIVAMAAGTAVVYGMGAVGLYVFLEYGVATAVLQGAVVFLPAEALKAAAAVGVVRSDAVTAA